MTPLHYACLCEEEALAQLLLEAGANPDIADSDGTTARSMGAEWPDLTTLLSRLSI